MQTNLQDYDRRASWTPPQSQLYNSRFVTAQDGSPRYAIPQNLAQTQRPVAQKPKAPQKMPRERAIALANRFKRAFAIASIIGFGTISGLVALHQVNAATTTQSTQSTQSSSGSSSSNSSGSSGSSNSSNSSSSTNSSSQSSNGYFNQQGGNTGGTSSSSSSSTSSSSSSSTVSGTHTS